MHDFIITAPGPVVTMPAALTPESTEAVFSVLPGLSKESSETPPSVYGK